MAEWHHLRSLYPIPVSPGAEPLDVVARAVETSSLVIGGKGRGGKGGGSSGWVAGMGTGTVGKNLSTRMACISVVVVPRSPDDLRRGGM